MKLGHRTMASALGAMALILFILLGPLAGAAKADTTQALMRDFVGINIHSGSIFQNGPPGVPALYRPTTTMVRDYHNFSWDLNSSNGYINFPYDKWNWINWTDLYGQWTGLGYRVNAVIQFNGYGDGDWVNPAADARRYGEAFATAFGPTVGSGVVTSVQIGNEPGHMSDTLYRTVFQNMAEGIRSVDPALKIVTSATRDSPSGSYHKSLSLFNGLTHLVDAFAVHSYPMIQGWPTWERSYPEDTQLSYLNDVQSVIDWRDTNAPSSEVWVTEFGYDATTQPNDPDGTFKDWMDVTDTQQAQWLTRSFLVFSEMDMDRAYMYYYNDNDTPSLHASSGLTRNWVPKPSYWAQSHLQDTLGDYRFSGVIRKETGGLYIYAYEHESDPNDIIWAIWLPTGVGLETLVVLEDLPGTPLSAERMSLADGPAETVGFWMATPDSLLMLATESPAYLHMMVSDAALLGDLNGDGDINAQDINPFVLALTDLPAWQALYPALDILEVGDFGGPGDIPDGLFNAQDINPFVFLLTHLPPTAVPEPASATLLLLGLSGLLWRRRRKA